MVHLFKVQRDILDLVESEPTHATFIRRGLDNRYEVKIRYGALYAQLDVLETHGYVKEVDGPTDERYALTERGRRAST